jgi:hypothetical protein
MTSSSGKTITQLNASEPGRTIIKVPANPPHTKTMRKFETCSPSKRAASKVTSKGEVITIAENSPTGKNCKLTMASKVVSINKAPRTIWIKGRSVINTVRPVLGRIKRVVTTA